MCALAGHDKCIVAVTLANEYADVWVNWELRCRRCRNDLFGRIVTMDELNKTGWPEPFWYIAGFVKGRDW